MNQVWHFLKLAVCLVYGVIAAVAFFIAMPYALPAAGVSVAFALMPE